MKRFIIIFFSLFSILILSACNISESNISDKINTPNTNNIPIIGKWEIKEYIDIEDENKEEDDLYLGEKAFFHKEAVIIGKDYATNPNFKFKKVKTEDYLLNKYKVEAESLNLRRKEIEVVSISNDNQHFYEFIKVNDNNLIVHIDRRFYKMRKIEDEVSKDEIKKYIDSDKSMFKSFDDEKPKEPKTGILLGIKTPIYDEINDSPQWEYQTIWINSKDRNIVNAYKLENLLLPRKNGFWMIDMEREIDNGNVEDHINMEPKMIVEDEEDSDEKIYEDKMEEPGSSTMSRPSTLPSILKNILFVGNDYISMENIDIDLGAKRTLQIYSLDNIEDQTPINLSDIIGEEGKEIFENSAENILSLDDASSNESNIGLVRKQGYWVFQGRVNYKKNNEELYKDFDIKAIPPEEMVSYDELSIPWNRLKMRVPQATDVYSSPNEDIIIVETRSALLIYPISNGSLTKKSPIKRIPLPNQASIVMAEWATEEYTDTWEEEVIKNGGKFIIDE